MASSSKNVGVFFGKRYLQICVVPSRHLVVVLRRRRHSPGSCCRGIRVEVEVVSSAAARDVGGRGRVGGWGVPAGVQVEVLEAVYWWYPTIS